jgi:hypothetical protein
MAPKQSTAFITARKGFCYVTVKYGRRNFHILRIRNYTLDAQDKRDLRRLYPDVLFDWKKITRQLAEKREACRCYRSRRRTSATARYPRDREPLYGIYEPRTRTVYVNDVPSDAHGGGALLDAILSMDCTGMDGPSPVPAPPAATTGRPHQRPGGPRRDRED